MKFFYKFTAIIFLLAINFYTAQKNSEVDKRDGFKTLKLGTTYDNFVGYPTIPSNNPNKIITLFRTEDADLSYLFDYKVSYFELIFDKSTKQLENIQAQILIKKPYSDPSVFNTYKVITSRLISVLGKPTEVYKREVGMCWVGNKIFMSVRIDPQKMSLDDEDNIAGLTLITFMVDTSIIKANNNAKDGF